MHKKIKLAGAAAIAVIIALAAIAIHLAHFTSAGSVDDVRANADTDSQITVSWDKLVGADGYYVYAGNGSGEYEQIHIDNPNATSYTASGLTQATAYDFYVVSYKNMFGKAQKTGNSKIATAYTMPSKQQIIECYSNDVGLINVRWEPNPSATGYQIKYFLVDGADADDTIAVVEGTDVNNYTVASLIVGKSYTVSVASCIGQDGEVIIGEYSDPVTVTVSDRVEMNQVIDPSKPMIALTFDDGPSYTSVTNDILDVLQLHKARATFFMVGTNARDNTANLYRKIELGCELGNHTATHQKYGIQLNYYDIADASDMIYNACGQYPTAFRSTGGITNDRIRTECYYMGMPLYFWSVDTLDWQLRDSVAIYDRVMSTVKDGDIILMHDIYPETAQAVKRMVPELIKLGYQLVTVSELVTAKTGAPPVPGEQYLDADTIKNNT